MEDMEKCFIQNLRERKYIDKINFRKKFNFSNLYEDYRHFFNGKLYNSFYILIILHIKVLIRYKKIKNF